MTLRMLRVDCIVWEEIRGAEKDINEPSIWSSLVLCVWIGVTQNTLWRDDFGVSAWSSIGRWRLVWQV